MRAGGQTRRLRTSLRAREESTPSVGIRPEIPDPQISFADLARHATGLIALSGDEHGEVPSLVAAGRMERALAAARRYANWLGPDNFFIELQQTLTYGDTERNRRLLELAQELGLGVVATNDVWYHTRARHRLHDVLTAIRHRSTLDGSHRMRHANSERYLKSAEEIAEVFEAIPQALANTQVIAGRCQFDLVHDLGYEFPSYPVPAGETAQTHLTHICWEALERKYPDPLEGDDLGEAGSGREATASRPSPSQLRSQAEERLKEELALIEKHGLAGFFLAYYDLLHLAGEVAGDLKGRDPSLPPDERPVGRGRGSSVSSIVCYLIGLSHIDPVANELFLGRFLNEELLSVPDIDLDFPRDVREQILKRIWTEFEGGRAALICAYSTYRGRGAIRDVGKALGLPALELDHLAKLADAWSTEALSEEMDRLPEFRAKRKAPLWRDLAEMSQQIMGLPRHVTQHVGGVVLSARPLQEYVPLEPTRMEGRVMCQWDKDSVDDARMVKIDFLALGMLSLVDECLDTIERRQGMRPDLGRIPHDDPEVYDQICAGDTIGTFQIESRAQITTLAHTQPRTLDDLAVQVAIVRPGPIVGGAFKPYMEYRRRLRAGEPVDVEYIHPCLEPVLKDTLGVVLYQEQVVQVAMAVAGYTAGEADMLRRNLNRRRGAELAVEDWPQFLERALAKGVPAEAARAAFQSVLGFAAYGFPKSHAVAFGLLAYESTWLRHYYPAEFYAALFNNQPMGFYSTEVIAGDARRHGIEIARPDINASDVLCIVEDPAPLPLGEAGHRAEGPRACPEPVEGTGEGESPSLSRVAERVVAYGLAPSPLAAFSTFTPSHPRIRLGLGLVKGVGEANAAMIVAEREASGPIQSLLDCAARTGLPPEALENLILAGAFDGPAQRPERRGESQASPLAAARPVGAPRLGGTGPARSAQGRGPRGGDEAPATPWKKHRRELLWELGLIRTRYAEAGAAMKRTSRTERAPSSGLLPLPIEQDLVALPPMSAWEEVAAEYETLGLAPAQHAMALLRPAIGERLKTVAEIQNFPDGALVRLAGLVTCRQRPSTAKGVVFVSLEDEFGLANVVVYAELFDRQRTLLVTEPFLIVEGKLQRQQSVVHIIADHFERPDIRSEHLIRVSHDFR